jgi:hypothetical protein
MGDSMNIPVWGSPDRCISCKKLTYWRGEPTCRYYGSIQAIVVNHPDFPNPKCHDELESKFGQKHIKWSE